MKLANMVFGAMSLVCGSVLVQAADVHITIERRGFTLRANVVGSNGLNFEESTGVKNMSHLGGPTFVGKLFSLTLNQMSGSGSIRVFDQTQTAHSVAVYSTFIHFNRREFDHALDVDGGIFKINLEGVTENLRKVTISQIYNCADANGNSLEFQMFKDNVVRGRVDGVLNRVEVHSELVAQKIPNDIIPGQAHLGAFVIAESPFFRLTHVLTKRDDLFLTILHPGFGEVGSTQQIGCTGL